MENHPIPQDVTGFQFKLIGDMTIKQFAYVAAGAILAFVCFYAPISPFIKLPIGVVFGLFGAALAFLPLEGRPVDAMVSYFIKALITPNQYAYHKIGGSIALFTIPAVVRTPAATAAITARQKEFKTVDENKAAQLKEYLQTVQKQTSSPLDDKEQLFLQHALSGSTQPIPAPTTPVQVTPVPAQATQPLKADSPLTPEEMKEQEANLALEAASVKYELNEAREHEAKEKDVARVATTHQQVTTLEQKLTSLLAQKEEIEKELALLKTSAPVAQTTPVVAPLAPQSPPPLSEKKLAAAVSQQLTPVQPATPITPVINIEKPAPAAPAPSAAPTIRKIPADMAKSIGLPRMPEVPNLIVGIVKDPRGNILQNILVEVKDKEGIPARAFRTNSLGQFASATPLSNGSYTIEFEDPKLQHKFDVVEIVAQGEIMLPLEIISHDAREELRKELFS